LPYAKVGIKQVLRPSKFSVTRKDFGSMQLSAKTGKFNISMLRPGLLKTEN
jgi:hypothetical protein